jgi:hypothetical protein
MGIHSDWKVFLKEKLFPQCWIANLPANFEFSHIIKDESIAFFALLSGVQTGDDIVQKFLTRTEQMILPTVKQISMLWDERDKTPKAKQAEQRRRKEEFKKSNEGKDVTPFTMEEIKRNNIRITTGLLPDITKIKVTPFLTHDIYRLCTDAILTSTSPKIEKVTIWIDGGRIESKDDPFDLQPINVIKHAEHRSTHLSGPKNCEIIDRKIGIGESDIKIIEHINKSPHRDIIIMSNDSDVIIATLLNFRNWVAIKDGKYTFTKRIYVDDGYKKAYLCVNSLWWQINKLFSAKYPKCVYNIETMVAIILIGGCDYVESNHTLGPATIWTLWSGEKFVKKKGGGYVSEVLNNRGSGYDALFSNDNYEKMIEFADGDYCYNEPDKVQCFRIVESQLVVLMSLWFIQKMHGKSFTPYTKRNLAQSMDDVDQSNTNPMEIRDTNNDLLGNKCEVPISDAMYAKARRIWWSMDYFSNGYKRKPLGPEVDKTTKLSLYGYIEVKEVDETGTERIFVDYAKKVHRYKKRKLNNN